MHSKCKHLLLSHSSHSRCLSLPLLPIRTLTAEMTLLPTTKTNNIGTVTTCLSSSEGRLSKSLLLLLLNDNIDTFASLLISKMSNNISECNILGTNSIESDDELFEQWWKPI